MPPLNAGRPPSNRHVPFLSLCLLLTQGPRNQDIQPGSFSVLPEEAGQASAAKLSTSQRRASSSPSSALTRPGELTHNPKATIPPSLLLPPSLLPFHRMYSSPPRSFASSPSYISPASRGSTLGHALLQQFRLFAPSALLIKTVL